MSALSREEVARQAPPSHPPLYTAQPLTTVSLCGRELWCIGTQGELAHPICVDPTDGSVLQHIRYGSGRLVFVDSDLAAFARALAAFVEGVPYPADLESTIDTDDPAAAEEAAAGLRARIQAIDPRTFATDDFWTTVADDVAMGDWS